MVVPRKRGGGRGNVIKVHQDLRQAARCLGRGKIYSRMRRGEWTLQAATPHERNVRPPRRREQLPAGVQVGLRNAANASSKVASTTPPMQQNPATHSTPRVPRKTAPGCSRATYQDRAIPCSRRGHAGKARDFMMNGVGGEGNSLRLIEVSLCPQDRGCGHVLNALRANRAYATRLGQRHHTIIPP
jgi:hypothetical protein